MGTNWNDVFCIKKLGIKMKLFYSDETGAVTIEWVILTASIVALALGAVSLIDAAKTAQVSTIASKIASSGS